MGHQLRESDQEIEYLHRQLQQLQEAIDKEAHTYKNNANKLIEELAARDKQLRDTEEFWNKSKAELKEVTQVKNNLQSTLSKQHSELSSLKTELSQCKSNLESEKKKTWQLES